MILVTGAAGTIGSELVRQLAERKARARALVRDSAKAEKIKAPGVEIVQGDLGDPSSLDAAMKGVDRVFLLSSVDQRQAELQGNVVNAAKRAGVRHLVKLGAAGTSLDSPIAVARFRAQTEMDIEAAGIPYTFLRPVLFMQFLLGTHGRSRQRVPDIAVPEIRQLCAHLNKAARERLRQAVPAEARRWCEIEERVSEGRAHQEILRMAAAEDVDLIVMGKHGHGAVGEMVFGSTSHHVVRAADCPVLTVRPCRAAQDARIAAKSRAAASRRFA